MNSKPGEANKLRLKGPLGDSHSKHPDRPGQMEADGDIDSPAEDAAEMKTKK
jgi:hypothetical protein